MDKAVDIVIAGGGMTGMILAIALARQNPDASIVVLESTLPSDQQPAFDGRCLALSAGTLDALISLDILSSFTAFCHPIETIRISEKGGYAAADLCSAESALKQFGAVIELNQAGFALQQLLKQYPRIRLMTGISLVSIRQEQASVHLLLSNQQWLESRLLVGADGARSKIPEQLHLPVFHYDFHQSALISTLQTTAPVDGQAWERFTEQGPMALLPLGKNRYSLVWCRETASAAALMQKTERDFLAHFQQQFGYRAGRLFDLGARACYPLSLYYVQPTIHHRVVMVGNAAHQLHPVAGQGFNLAMRDIVHLAEVISVADRDPGSFQTLNAYEQKRQSDQLLTMQLTSSLTALFQSGIPPIPFCRQLGLAMVSQSHSLQRLIIEQALGYTK